MKPLSVSIGMVVDGDDILMIKRSNSETYRNYWAIPGGKVETEEHPRQAVQREINEEAGLKAENPEARGLVSEHLLDNGELDQHFLIHVFSLDAPNRRLNHVQSEDINADWLPVSDCAQRSDVVPSDRRFIQTFLQNDQDGYYECVLNEVDGEFVFEQFECVTPYRLS